jgi:hypothetical protein
MIMGISALQERNRLAMTIAPNRSALIRWELGWVAVEASVAVIGLWFMLGAGLPELGSGIMFLLVAISLFVRCQHYVGMATTA